MPSFNKRHGRYEIRFKKNNRQPKEKAESLPLDTAQTQVKRIEAEMNAAYYSDWDPWKQSWKEYKNGEPAGSYRVDMARDDFIRYCKRNNRWNSYSTERNNRDQLGWFVDFVGPHKQASQISNFHLSSFLSRKDVKAGTLKTYYRNIKAFINWLKEQGHNSNDFPYRPSREVDHSILYFTEQEKDKIVAGISQSNTRYAQEYKDIWNLMFYQAMRSGEVFCKTDDGRVGIQAQHITGTQITIYGKGNKIRVVPIVGPIRDMLLERKFEAEQSDGMLFKFVCQNAFYQYTKKIIKDSLPEHRHKLNLHSLRRGGGVYWVQKGKPLAAIKELLGHSSIKTTEKYYARFQPDGLESVFA